MSSQPATLFHYRKAEIAPYFYDATPATQHPTTFGLVNLQLAKLHFLRKELCCNDFDSFVLTMIITL
jgi:hypothetical protein